MNKLSIHEWKVLAKDDPDLWKNTISNLLRKCLHETGSSVIAKQIDFFLEESLGALAGVPYVLKDLFDFQNYRTTCSSVMPDLFNRIAHKDAHIASLLSGKGALCVAKTQLNEFAYGLSGENAHYGDCFHPRLTEHLIGGSSSGSAYMVSAGIVPFSIGSDTVGSVRVPAAWGGIYGLRLPPRQWMEGCFPLSKTFDSLGWFTRKREDMAYLSSTLLSTLNLPKITKGAVCWMSDFLDQETRNLLQIDYEKRFSSSCSHENELVDMLPDFLKAFGYLRSWEALCIHEKRVEEFQSVYDPATLKRIIAGREVSESDLVWAKEKQVELIAWVDQFFNKYDFLLIPAVPCPAVRKNEVSEELRKRLVSLNVIASFAQKPALTLPVYFPDRQKTVGWQVIFNHIDSEAISSFLNKFETV